MNGFFDLYGNSQAEFNTYDEIFSFKYFGTLELIFKNIPIKVKWLRV